MKKAIKKFICLSLMLFVANLFAKDFDWSECWCNYGANIQKGTKILTIDTGITWDYITPIASGGWAIPAINVDFQVAAPIWKLPFTFGGYAIFYGYNNTYDTFWHASIGSEANYHVRFPPTQLDLYASLKTGIELNFSKYYAQNIYLWPEIGGAIGASWYFSDVFGVNLEIGYPINKLGLSFKF